LEHKINYFKVISRAKGVKSELKFNRISISKESICGQRLTAERKKKTKYQPAEILCFAKFFKNWKAFFLGFCNFKAS
jgi:hypothetical protein